MSDFEGRIEALCNVIVNSDAELWDARNKAVLEITVMITRYEGLDYARIPEIFTPSIFRLLKEPVKTLIVDLRSQQVRDTCLLLSKLSEVTKDHMKLFLRDIFVFLLDGIKVPNRVMSGYVDTTIMTIIKNTTYKGCIPLLVAELRDSKSKLVRERCMEYINEILIRWDIAEKDADAILDTIRVTLEDASVRARENARLAYLNLYAMYPRKTDKIKAGLPNSLRIRMTKCEAECVSQLSQGNHQHPAAQQVAPSSPAGASGALSPRLGLRKSSTAGSATMVTAAAAANAVAAAASMSLSSSSSFSASPTHALSINFDDDDVGKSSGRHSILALRAPRQTYEEEAVTSIQALIRGKLTRRQTMMLHPIGEEEGAGEGEENDERKKPKRATIAPLSPTRKGSVASSSTVAAATSGSHLPKPAAKTPRAPTFSSEDASIMPPPAPIPPQPHSSRLTRKKHLTMLLKKKVAHTMKKLEAQMNLVNELETGIKQSDGEEVGAGAHNAEHSHDVSLSKQISDLLRLVGEETQMCHEFQSKLQALL